MYNWVKWKKARAFSEFIYNKDEKFPYIRSKGEKDR